MFVHHKQPAEDRCDGQHESPGGGGRGGVGGAGGGGGRGREGGGEVE